VTNRRTSPHLHRRGLLALAVACALAGPVLADPMPSRDYPPTYSSKKAPWYDPLRVFTSTEKTYVVPASESRAIPNEAVEPGTSATPAWKWYGYGTPTPGRNPLAPTGSYPAVPPTWHTTSGTTPGAIPTGRLGAPPVVTGVIPDPLPLPKLPVGPGTSIAITPPDSPIASAPPSGDNVDWKSAAASLRPPTAATPVSNDAPRATLKAPVRDDGPSTPPPTPVAQPQTPLQRELPSSESPDIPVEAAPGIVVPTSGVSRGDGPMTARGLPPSGDLSTLIHSTCGTEIRVLEVSAAGPKGLIIRFAGTVEAALAARERLSHLDELRSWRVEFDLVTPVRP
jgi:hypothetical protein